jgi:hypothetical protein
MQPATSPKSISIEGAAVLQWLCFKWGSILLRQRSAWYATDTDRLNQHGGMGGNIQTIWRGGGK